MLLKNKTVKYIIYLALIIVTIYTGVSCVATLHKAGTLPHLISETSDYYFMGYYMVAVANGTVCIVSALILFLLRKKK